MRNEMKSAFGGKKIDGIYQKVKNVLAEPKRKIWLRWGLVLTLIFGLLLSVAIVSINPQKTAAVSSGDGILFYAAAANTTPQFRNYDNATNNFSANSGTVAGAQPTITQIKTSPFKQEAIAGYQDTSGNLRVLCYNGTTWSEDWTVVVAGAGTPTTRRFDIAYETNTGDVTVAYSRNTAAVNALAYRTKAGSTGCGSANWAGTANFPTTTTVTSATVVWVRAARDGRSAQNLSAWVWEDNAATNSPDIGAAIWSGTAFTNFKVLETAAEYVAAGGDTDSFEVQYESLSGDLMVVWGSGGSGTANGAYYNICAGGTSSCTWNASRTAIPSLANDATNVDLSSDPLSDKMIFASIGNGGSDMQAAYWTGAAPWSGYNDIDASCEIPIAGSKKLTTGWLNNNGYTQFYISYDDSTGTGVGWFAATPGTVLTTSTGKQSDFASTPSINDVRGRYDTDVNPFTNAELIQTLSDVNNPIDAYKLSMDASGNLSWSNMASAASLGTKPSHPQQGFSFTYWRYIPPVVTVGTSGSQTANLVIPSSGNYVGGAFTFIRDSGSANITSIKMSEKGSVNANTNLSNLKLYYETSGTCSRSSPTQFGTGGASFNASDEATVTGTMAVGTLQVCIYVDLDVGSGATDNQTLEIEITNPSTDLIVSAGVILPASKVEISGTTNLKGNLTVAATGSQTFNMNVPSNDNYVGGAFTFVRSAGSANVTQIIISEAGDVNANANLSDLKLFYKQEVACSASIPGDATAFNVAGVGFDGSENAIATGTMSVGTSQICLYAQLDVGSGASNGQLLDLEITTPSTEVTVSSGTVTPGTAITISGSTTLQVTNVNPNDPATLTQKTSPGGVTISESAWTTDNTPDLGFTISDNDVGDTVKYQIQLDGTSSSFSNLVLDYTYSTLSANPTTFAYAIGQAGGTYAVGSQGMTLSDSSTGYWWRVKAIDNSGALSNYVEAGVAGTVDFKVDATAPTALTVYDGTSVGVDQDYSGTALNSLAANWTAANFNVSGPATPNKYQYAIGTTSGGTDILTWTSTNTDGAVVTANSLTVNTSIMYFWTVKATDLAGNITMVSSNGQIIEPSLSFSFDTSTVTFTNLGTPAWTDTKETNITTQTNAKNGYSVQAHILQLLTQLTPPYDTIDNWSGTYAAPASWAGNCAANSQCGFGYTSSDPNITTDSRGNMYNSGANYCAYSQSSPGDVVADNNGPTIDGSRALIDQVFTLTHKVSVDQNQTAGQYQTTLMLMATVNY